MSAYLSAREAADYCGVSEKTIRNWLAAGRLSADKSAGAFRIPQEHLDALRRNSPRRPHPADRQAEASAEEVRAERPPSVPVADILALLRDAQAEAIAKAEAAAMWQTRAEVLSMQLDQARTELRALHAPAAPADQNDQEGPYEGRRTAEGLEMTSETPTPPPPAPVPSPTPEPTPPPAPAPIPPGPNGSGWWGRVQAWLLA